MSWLSQAVGGKSLFGSKTIWSLLASGAGYVLPVVVDKLHLTDAGQSAFVNTLSSLVTLGGLVAAGAFRASATQPIVSILPQKDSV